MQLQTVLGYVYIYDVIFMT